MHRMRFLDVHRRGSKRVDGETLRNTTLFEARGDDFQIREFVSRQGSKLE